MRPKGDDSDSDHVPIQKISPHPKPGVNESFFEEFQPSYSDSDQKTQNPYDNVNLTTQAYSLPVKQDVMSTTTHSTMSSTTSHRSNGMYLCNDFHISQARYVTSQ